MTRRFPLMVLAGLLAACTLAAPASAGCHKKKVRGCGGGGSYVTYNGSSLQSYPAQYAQPQAPMYGYGQQPYAQPYGQAASPYTNSYGAPGYGAPGMYGNGLRGGNGIPGLRNIPGVRRLPGVRGGAMAPPMIGG